MAERSFTNDLSVVLARPISTISCSAASGELVTFFEKPLLYYLRRMVGSEADAWDLVQESWVSVFRALPKLRNARVPPAFLDRAARNHALAHLRRRDVNLRLYAVAVDCLAGWRTT